MFNNYLPNERELLLQLSQDSEEAFEKLYHFYSPRIYLKLFRILKSEFFAQELLQEVFLKIWESRQNIDLAKSFRCYLFCITVNKCYDFFRKAIRDKKLQVQLLKVCECEHNIEESLVQRENTKIFYHAINLLPPKRRQVFRLCKLEGKSYNEVSQELGVSPSTISDHIVKANNFIRSYFFRITI